MKRIFTIMALAAFILPLLAQSPDLMSYQAVLRDAENHLLTNHAVAVQISIMQGTPNSTPVYSEVHSLSTNANGLVSLEIGNGVTGDDLSTIDWSTGPFFLRTETDPDGGTNYTISSTTQLLSVPYAKYADEAGNIFSGDYGDLTGSPTVLSAFGNDVGYLTNVTGTEPAFVGWDKDESDDFSGAYGDLTGAPTNVSHFTNDAGYLTSHIWSLNGSNVYYNGGRVGIGTSTPSRFMVINSGNELNYLTFHNMGTGTTGGDGFMVGNETDLEGYVWNWENAPIHFGTNNNFRMTLSGSGDFGIGTTTPATRLDVIGDTKFGTDGVAFDELREITGTTAATGSSTLISWPSGYNPTNTRILAAEINFDDMGWTTIGSHFRVPPTSLINQCVYMNSAFIYLYYPNEPEYHSVTYRILIMRIAP